MRILDNTSKKRKVKTIHTTKRIVISFFLLVLIGSILLTLSQCNNESTSYINHLFIATSAVCVTGLVPVTPAIQYTRLGQIIIIVLIQIGGLGFLTFYSMMISWFSKKLSYENRMLMTEALNQNSMEDIKKYIRRVVKYTFFFELIGAICLSIQFIPEFGLKEGIYYSVFHAISAFCNAGFDVLGASSLCHYDTNVLVNLTISGLIIAGGLGFFVWTEIRNSLIRYKKEYKVFSLKVYIRSYSLHTKIAVMMTILLLFLGTVSTFVLEYNHVLINYNLFDKLLVSFFTSTTLRTAGFATINFGATTRASKLIMCIFMLIGGSPTGTAGGIKTVTFAVTILYLLRLFKGKNEVVVFKKKIDKETVEKSLTIFIVGLILCFIGVLVLSISEPNIAIVDIIFEVFSAFGTVGLSCGVTPCLSIVGKLMIIVLMFFGRVGPLTIFMMLTQSNHMKGNDVSYPNGNIIIG